MAAGTTETYNIGFGTYPKVATADAEEYLRRQKQIGFDVGFPVPNDDQMRFRKLIAVKPKQRS